MIDVTSETLIPIGKTAGEIERLTGDRPHRATIERWRMRGCHGVKLETVKIGGKRYTSQEALHRFVAAVTAAADGDSHATTQPSAERRRAIQTANRELDAAGL